LGLLSKAKPDNNQPIAKGGRSRLIELDQEKEIQKMVMEQKKYVEG